MTITHAVRPLATAFSALALLALSACAAPEEGPVVLTAEQIRDLAAAAEDNGWLEQAEAMRDGTVDAQEYANAFENFSACMSELGYAAPATWISPMDGVTIIFEIDPGGRSDDQQSEDSLACQDKYFSMVAGAHQDTQPYEMDEGIRLAAIQCLRSEGFALDGEEDTPLEMAGPGWMLSDGTRSDQWRAAVKCLQLSQFELFPEIPYSVVTDR